MKSMQRKFGTLMKRTDDDTDVQTVLDEFKAVDSMLDLLLRELKAWRNGWEDILKFQYDTIEAFALLYKPIEPTADPDMRHQPAQTPAKYMQKCLTLQKDYSDMKADLAQEIAMIDNKLINPVEKAKLSTKMLHKTIKHRENMKLDYERYTSRAERGRKKEIRSAREEAALDAHENNLAQARIDYQTADEHVRQTFPPVSAAVVTIIPPILANMTMLQTTLVGQLYTVVDAYTRKVGLPNPAPLDSEIIAAWDNEYMPLKREIEQSLSTLAKGKIVNIGMALPEEKDKSTISGFGIRNKVMQRAKPDPSIPVRPAASSSLNRRASFETTSDVSSVQEEMAPPKPPRPGAAPSPSAFASSKPRIPSFGAVSAHSSNGTYDHNPPPPYPLSPSPKLASTLNTANLTASTPPSRYLTPVNGTSPQPSSASNTGADYFAARRTSAASLASSAAAAAKKKPPPPVPAKRFPSTPQPQFVTALYEFEGQNPGDLAFREGDRIKVVKKTDSTDDWWEGELRGQVGSFPANYVSLQ